MENFTFATSEEIKSQLRRGDYDLITLILSGKYSKSSVESQIRGYRTLKEDVRKAAEMLIKSRNQLINQSNL